MAADDDEVGAEMLRRLHDHVDGRPGRDVCVRSGTRSGRRVGNKSCELFFGIPREVESSVACPFGQQRVLCVQHVQRRARLSRERDGKLQAVRDGSEKSTGARITRGGIMASILMDSIAGCRALMRPGAKVALVTCKQAN